MPALAIQARRWQSKTRLVRVDPTVTGRGATAIALVPLLIALVMAALVQPVRARGGGATAPPYTLQRIMLPVVKGIRSLHCLDGSPPGYYLRTSQNGVGNDSWIIHLRQGGWCSTSAACRSFASSDVGSSRFTIDPSERSFNSSRFALNWFQGLLSANRSINPTFYNFNVAELLYCDGGLYAGTAGRVPVAGSKDQFIYSEGDKIWKAVFQDLLSRGLADARSVLVSGASAGGQAAALRCDEVAASLPRAKVKCIMDGGYFVDTPSRSDYRTFRANVINITALHKPVLHAGCVDAVSATSQWKCWFPSYFLRFVSSPVYIINSDIDPTALVIGKQLDNYSNTNWLCINGIAQARGSLPFCSAAAAPAAVAASTAAATDARSATATVGTANNGAAAGAGSNHQGRAERILRSVARRSRGVEPSNDTSNGDGSSIKDSGTMDGSQSNNIAKQKLTTSASCPGGAETAVDTYGQQVCKSINDLLGKRSNLAAFIIGRPLHAIAIYNTWDAVSVNGQNLKDTISTWWKDKQAGQSSVVPV